MCLYAVSIQRCRLTSIGIPMLYVFIWPRYNDKQRISNKKLYPVGIFFGESTQTKYINIWIHIWENGCMLVLFPTDRNNLLTKSNKILYNFLDFCPLALVGGCGNYIFFRNFIGIHQRKTPAGECLIVLFHNYFPLAVSSRNNAY